MSIETVNTVIFSPCGGPRNGIDALTQNIGCPVRNHDITLPHMRAKGLEFGMDDFVFFGFPVYGGRMPKNIKKLFEEIKGNNTPCALVVVYGNRAFDGAMRDLQDAAGGVERPSANIPLKASTGLDQFIYFHWLLPDKRNETSPPIKSHEKSW